VVRRDESRAIVISRKGVQADTIRTGAKHAPWQIFQIEYDYNFSRYTTAGDHNLLLRGTGRVGDARLSFTTNSSVGVSQTSSYWVGQSGWIARTVRASWAASLAPVLT